MSKYWVFQDESGEPGKDDYFIVGMLGMTPGVKRRLLDKVKSIREIHKFNDEMHFHKFSNKRYQVYKDVLDEAFKCYFSFRSIAVHKNKVDIRKFFGNQRHLAYNKFTELLTYHHIKSRNEEIHIRPDNKNRLKVDNFYEYLVNHLNDKAWLDQHSYTVKSCKSVDSKTCDASQVCDLITGVVKNRFMPAGDRKNEFSSYIFEKYSDKINIWEWNPRR